MCIHEKFDLRGIYVDLGRGRAIVPYQVKSRADEPKEAG